MRTVTDAIIRTLKKDDPALRRALGTRNFEEVRERGIVVGHDNRFLGAEFAREVMGLLTSEEIRVYYCGETSTPEMSVAIEMLGAACAINITPSHNPANYSGLKLNPSDGGPAGTAITDVIEVEANRLMAERDDASTPLPPARFEAIDATDLYLRYLRDRRTLDLDRIRHFAHSEDCQIVVDHVHGSTRGRPERLLGIDEVSGGNLVALRTEDNYLFGGVAPEPSEVNMEGVVRCLRGSRAKFRIGVIMDPDGDRIRFADHVMQIPMNYFGAMALHFFHVYKGFRGIAAKSVGTSDFVNAIAAGLGIAVRETKVGFKNFRPYLKQGSLEPAVIAFEESDGISAQNHTLEKDALFGLLLALEMVATTGKNLSEYLAELMDAFGHYYPDRAGIAVDRSINGQSLRNKLSSIAKTHPPGSVLTVGERQLRVKDLVTIDGTKLVLEDGSWLMMRASGTE
ncbi:MAG: phosphomannomutase, partial [Thermodesulfovibrionales bacterium]